VQFLTTKQVSGEVERVVREAEQFITLITPYIRIPDIFVVRLKAAQDKGVKVRLVLGKVEAKPDEEDKLRYLDRTEVYFLENLHAKCYLNENRAIVTSMNLHQFSEANNREMGIAVLRREDGPVYDEVKAEADQIARDAVVYFRDDQRAAASGDAPGYCVHCGRSIDFDPDKPLCRECYREWSRRSNSDYTEDYCHSCGDRARTSVRRPLCDECFRSL
jgi:phosphatidylserine/phosphatidylglycerophosphate/cardiolipin synthase-like enzyme